MNLTNLEKSLNPLILERWSPRAFAETPVTEEQITRLFEAAKRAPSSYNIQPWRFIYTHKEESGYNDFFDALMEPNQQWAKQAPVLFITLAQTHDNSGNPNPYSWHDVGIAMGHLLMQATHDGLRIHQMGGYYADKARENLRIPEGFEPVAMGAIGYEGDPESLPEPFMENELSPATRKPIKELLFKGQWGRIPGHIVKDSN